MPQEPAAPSVASMQVQLDTADQMAELGRRLATVLRAGDLVLLTGDLGAGKTTLAAGLGAGLQVRGRVTSPTFVIAREHPPLGSGPALVHVDAYRLGGLAEVDDLDLDASLEDAVTVVEWGAGLVEDLAEDRLEVSIVRATGGEALADAPAATRSDGDVPVDGHEPVDEVLDPRVVVLQGFGQRWAGVNLDALVGR